MTCVPSSLAGSSSLDRHTTVGRTHRSGRLFRTNTVLYVVSFAQGCAWHTQGLLQRSAHLHRRRPARLQKSLGICQGDVRLEGKRSGKPEMQRTSHARNHEQ